MADTALRIRVERLLRGEFRVEDLTTLFLAMRDRCDGREAVREIGDFAAHRDERTKGITTRTVREFFTLLKFGIPRIGESPLSLVDLPPNIADVMRATFSRLDSQLLRKYTGMKRITAQKALIDVIARIQRDVTGRYILPWPTESDARLVECLTNFIISREAFNDERLCEEFTATLSANSLLRKNETKQFRALAPAITLYAISVMHLCSIDLGDETAAILEASPAAGERGKLGVLAKAEVWRKKGMGPGGSEIMKPILAIGPIFVTNLDASVYCETELLIPSTDRTWGEHLEVTAQRTLAMLR
jgi:hypothetical protein